MNPHACEGTRSKFTVTSKNLALPYKLELSEIPYMPINTDPALSPNGFNALGWLVGMGVLYHYFSRVSNFLNLIIYDLAMFGVKNYTFL